MGRCSEGAPASDAHVLIGSIHRRLSEGFASSSLHAVGTDSAYAQVYFPSDKDWSLLTDTTLAASKAGKELKASAGWFPSGNGSGNGTDASGFRALPGGDHSAAFDVLGENAAFWSATEGLSEYAWFRIIYNGSDLVHRFSCSKTYGFSLRCVQD